MVPAVPQLHKVSNLVNFGCGENNILLLVCLNTECKIRFSKKIGKHQMNNNTRYIRRLSLENYLGAKILS